jgi:hypothetical protein
VSLFVICGAHCTELEIKNHLLYVDDRKLTGRSEEELRNDIKVVKTFGTE